MMNIKLVVRVSVRKKSALWWTRFKNKFGLFGSCITEFEKGFANYCECEQGIAVANGTVDSSCTRNAWHWFW